MKTRNVPHENKWQKQKAFRHFQHQKSTTNWNRKNGNLVNQDFEQTSET